jgi:DNA-binding transcriptional MerR regulator
MLFFTTSKAAASAGVSADTMRRYADAGIIKPLRDSSGRRLFSEADIERAKQHIAKATQRGVRK